MSGFWPIIEIKHAVFNLKRSSVCCCCCRQNGTSSKCSRASFKWLRMGDPCTRADPYTVRLTVVMQQQQQNSSILISIVHFIIIYRASERTNERTFTARTLIDVSFYWHNWFGSIDLFLAVSLPPSLRMCIILHMQSIDVKTLLSVD